MVVSKTTALVEMFVEHPERMPYPVCPECEGRLKVFSLYRRPVEAVFYCPDCDWNESVTDMDEVAGEPVHGAGSKTYLHGDFLVTATPEGNTLVENMSDHDQYSTYRRPIRPGAIVGF